MTLLASIGQALTRRHAVSELERGLQGEQLFDTVIAGLSGIHTPEAADLRALSGDAIADCAGLTSATTRLSEIDDIHLPSCVTPSAVAVPTALAIVARTQDVSPERIAHAIRAGTELIVRFGVAIDGAHILYRGIWPTYLAAPLGAAATAGSLFGLDEIQMAHALALSLSMSSGTIGRPPEARTGRWFMFATAVTIGVRAAEAARLGLFGDLQLLEGDWLERMKGVRLDREPLQAMGSDEVYATLSQKPYCTGRQCLAAGQAFRTLIEEGLNPSAATSIRVRVPTAYAGMISVKPDPQSRSSTIIGASLQLALAALRPDARYLVDRRSIQDDAALFAYAQRVSVIPDETLQLSFPRQWPAIVEVDTPDGTLVKEVHVARGDPADRLTRPALIDKAHATLDPVFGRAAVSSWIERIAAASDDAAACRTLAKDFVAAMRAGHLADSYPTMTGTVAGAIEGRPPIH